MIPLEAIDNKQPVIRAVTQADEAILAAAIKLVAKEFGDDGEGSATRDKEVQKMFQTYIQPRTAYLVVELDGMVIGGAGIKPLEGTEQNICEVRKFFVLSQYRGHNLTESLLEHCIKFAIDWDYDRCYVEALDTMKFAESLYLNAGFTSIPMPLGNTGHEIYNRWYEKNLRG